MDNRRERSATTQRSLMRAAERLIAARGIENVSIRDIVDAAGQKNQSALQYHFGNLQGLIGAIQTARNAQVQAARSELLRAHMERNSEPTLRDICQLMVRPAFELARSERGFRHYVKAFGHRVTLAEDTALSVLHRPGDESIEQTGTLLRAALAHLDTGAYRRRIDGALRFVSAAMFHEARQKRAFQGAPGELFYSSLIDALGGLLSAPESDETRAASRAIGDARA